MRMGDDCDVLGEEQRLAEQPAPERDDPRRHVQGLVDMYDIRPADHPQRSPDQSQAEDRERHAEASFEDIQNRDAGDLKTV
jgi:hypothetical protein